MCGTHYYVLVVDEVGGESIDYTYEELGVVFSYTMVGRDVWTPNGTYYGFLAPPSEIAPSGEENWAALKDPES